MNKPHKTRQRGLGLTECLMCLLMLAMLAGVGTPHLLNSMNRQRLEGQANELLHTLHWGRSTAVSTRQTMRLRVQQTSAGACYVVHSGNDGDCTCNTSGEAQCSNGALAHKSVLLRSSEHIQLESNVSSLAWEPLQGRATPAASLNLTHPSGQSVRLVVSMMGRVRTCAPTGSARHGHPAC